MGTVFIHPLDVIKEFFGAGDGSYSFILWKYRTPRVIVAILSGIGLSTSGTILQGVIRNPLASPDVIGITKGAGFAAVTVILIFPKLPSAVLPIAAFVGGIAVTLILLLLTFKQGLKPNSIALTGLALGSIFGAGIQYLTVKYPMDVNAAILWLTGSLWGTVWKDVWFFLPWICILFPLTLVFSSKLDILQLGTDLAVNLGEKVENLRIILIAISVVLASASVSFVGSMGFVGLIAPHIARLLVGAKHKYIIPVSAMVGSSLILSADLIGRTIIPPMEIPVGIFTAIMGAPYFLYLIRRKKPGKVY